MSGFWTTLVLCGAVVCLAAASTARDVDAEHDVQSHSSALQLPTTLARSAVKLPSAAEFIAMANPVMRKSIKLTSMSVKQSMQDVDAYGRRTCAMVNQIRAQHGRRALFYSGTLTQRAYAHSQWMYTYNVFTHQDIGRLGFYVYDRRVGGNRYMHVNGENIANSVHRSGDVSNDFHWQWVYSPPHFQNMLGAGHTHCGTGFAFDSRTNMWWATQLFGVNDAPFPDEWGGQTPA